MTFSEQLHQFATKTRQDEQAIFVGTVVEVRDSVKFGSATTGAPAMPVAPGEFKRSGALRDSVIESYPDPNTALIYTTAPYAQDVEFNTKGHQFNVGGPFGWTLTAAGFARVLESVTRRITGYR